MCTYYTTFHMLFQQIISANSSLYKQIPQLLSKRKSRNCGRGLRQFWLFVSMGNAKIFVYSGGVLFKGKSAIRFEEDFAEPKGSVGGDAEGGSGFV